MPITTSFRLALLATLAVTSAAVGQQPPDTAKTVTRRPNRLDELVTTATRTTQTVSSNPFTVTAVTRADIASSSAPSVPNMLWRLPGFSLRDYQSSIIQSQTVRMVPSFRGLSGSSAGRTLVLLDGVPVNESFSGRINWNRIPLSLVDRIEVVRGGGSMLWGSRALGGVINILTANPARTGLGVVAEGGRFGTYRGSVDGALRSQKLSGSLAADWSGTDGVITVRKDQAGAADSPTGGVSKVLFGRVAYDFSPGLTVYLAGNYLMDESKGPTPLSDGSYEVGELRGGARLATGGGAVFHFAGYVNEFDHRALRTSISSDRQTISPNGYQNIPAHSLGGSLQWSQTVSTRHQLTAGLDLARTDGSIIEGTNFQNGRVTLERRMEGNQLLGGAFLQDQITLTEQWRLQAGLRLDGVRNYGGHRTDIDPINNVVTSDTGYAARTFTRLNYSLGVRHALSSALSWRSAVYGAFRAPTLNEIYQTNYSSRGSLTAANELLRPERLIGVETGADLEVGGSFLARATVFWNRVSDAIVDFTLGTATTAGQVIEPCGPLPRDQVCRQRRNVAALRSVGLESEVEFHPAQDWSLWAGYTFNPTRISAEGQAIDGKVARAAVRHTATAVVTYENPALFSASLEGRYVGSRSDDDLDTIRLESFFVTGLRLNRRLWSQSSAYIKVENLFDTEYPVAQAANGLVDVGAPRWVTVGIRAAW
jgi:iron complex outermembrane receptor protein